MLNDATGLKNIFLKTGATDLRKGIDGLATIVSEHFGLNPFEPDTLFIFCGRRSDRIKCLHWESDGFLLLYKRIEAGSFKWPRNESEVKAITHQQFTWLMQGLAIEQKKLIEKVTPSKVS
jgi:transposase